MRHPTHRSATGQPVRPKTVHVKSHWKQPSRPKSLQQLLAEYHRLHQRLFGPSRVLRRLHARSG